ncbi:MAG: Smr/MutS family protein [Bacteroidaceae bacterium]|nr:Smr/MutS family protein [Bacteroidaceae bacterium]
MTYPQNFEDKIGFSRIRELLSERCLCTLGLQRVQEMKFSDDFDNVTRMISETDEMMRILDLGNFPDSHFYDTRTALKRIRIENTFFETDELLELCRSLATISQIVNYLQKTESDIYLYPRLAKKCEHIATFVPIVKKITHILDDYGNVMDSASKDLARIRREIRNATNSISRLLNNILKSAQSEGLVEKNVTPTLRDGRLVIPVAPALKRKIGGIVHDESDSGRTVYIEPTQVVEANNQIRELENEERREITRILREISAEIRPYADEMLLSYEFLADIDFIRAKALFSKKIGAVKPCLVSRQSIDWSMAVHPLLRLSFDKKNQKVVPLDIELKSPNQRIVLISGPNAGGKSVCLKTVGLVQYMLQCGMPVPLSEGSQCGIFKHIYIDIGDEQSLEDDLSTYSSHLLNMKYMLRHSDATTLLLIDEFGGGTEPQIGGAMAEAILKRFNYKHAFGVITTHYQNLKQLAQETDGIVNGAMLYDRQEMQPLFQLRIGNPGSSFAVEIARKIGIPEDVIQDASDIVGQDYINADKYLQDIVRDKRYWENKRQSIHQHEKKMEQTIERYEADIQRLQEEKKVILAKAKEQAQQLLSESNARIEQTIREIKEAQAEKERTKNIRQDFADFKQEVHNIDTEAMEERVRRQMEKIKARQQRRKDKKLEKANSPTLSSAPEKPKEIVLAEGMYVRMKGQTVVGQIQKINGTEAQVIFGSIQTNIKLKKLEPASKPKQEKRADTFVSRETQDNIRDTSLHFKTEIDVRGMRADEALQAVTYFVDDALVASASRISILHGTGNGILRTLIRQYLATIPAVADYHDEHPQFGGAGITVVDLI